MLDLREQLLKAGLVTEDQVEKAEKKAEKKQHKKKKGKGKGKPRSSKGKGASTGASEAELWRKRVNKLAEAPRAEQYDVIRGWVERTRLDGSDLPSEAAERFHFEKGDGAVSWLTLEPPVIAQLRDGTAGIIAWMSHNGLKHCVVPRDVAVDVHQVRPEWLRALANYEFTAERFELSRRKKKPAGSSPGEASDADATAGGDTATEDSGVDAAALASTEAVDAKSSQTTEDASTREGKDNPDVDDTSKE